MSDDNVENKFNIYLSVLSILILTCCGLVTISLLPSSLALSENVSREINALIENGNALGSLGNHTEAIQYYDKALAIDPRNFAALNNKGVALKQLGKYTEAIQYYDKALAIDPNYKHALDNKQLALSKMGAH